MQSLDDFLRLLVASEMIDQEDADALRDEFAGKSASECADGLIATGVLTRWQADCLLAGRYKGFFLHHFKLIDKISYESGFNRMLAENLRTRKRVILRIYPPKGNLPFTFSVETPQTTNPAAPQ